jgi:Tripartite tricarboxylate transporter family receptor
VGDEAPYKVRSIAATAACLVSHARAAENEGKVIALSCEGTLTRTYGANQPADPEPFLYPELNFNFIRDIAMVAGLTRSAEVLEANPAVPVRSVPELIAYVKTNPGKLTLGSFGTGTISHIAGVLQKRGWNRNDARAVSRLCAIGR